MVVVEMDELNAASKFLASLEERATAAEGQMRAVSAADHATRARPSTTMRLPPTKAVREARAASAQSARRAASPGRPGSRGASGRPGSRGGAGGDDVEARSKAFLAAFRTQSRLAASCVFVQKWYRMARQRTRMGRWRARRRARLALHVRAWLACSNARLLFDRHLQAHALRALREYVDDARRTRGVAFEMFARRLGKKRLSIASVNLFFSEGLDFPDPLSLIHISEPTRPY